MSKTESIVLELLHDINSKINEKNKDNLIENGSLDSLAILTAVDSIESKFDIEFAPEDIVPSNFHSVSAISELVERLM